MPVCSTSIDKPVSLTSNGEGYVGIKYEQTHHLEVLLGKDVTILEVVKRWTKILTSSIAFICFVKWDTAGFRSSSLQKMGTGFRSYVDLRILVRSLTAVWTRPAKFLTP